MDYAAGQSDNGMDTEGEHEEGGYCIEIYVGADNQVKGVSVEQKSMGEGGEVEMEAKMPAKSIDQALMMAQKIYQAGGQVAMDQMQGDMQQGMAEQEQSDLMQGYGRGNIRGGGMPMRNVFSNGEG